MTEDQRMQMLLTIMNQNEMILDQNYQILQLLVPMEYVGDDGDEEPPRTLQ